MRVQAGGHILRADEPAEQGGTDTGPTPHDLLLAALGTCTAMTLRMYAARKGWPLVDAHVSLTGERLETGYRIQETIALEGDLDAAMRARLMVIAARCPVHRTLAGTVHIETREGGLS